MKKVIIFLFAIIIIALIKFTKSKNPYNDVIWIEDSPGANGRVIEFTPVLKSNHKIKLSEGFAVDYGTIRFADIGNDGIKETIIESKMPFYRFDDMYQPSKIIIKYIKKGNETPSFKVIEETSE